MVLENGYFKPARKSSRHQHWHRTARCILDAGTANCTLSGRTVGNDGNSRLADGWTVHPGWVKMGPFISVPGTKHFTPLNLMAPENGNSRPAKKSRHRLRSAAT